MLAARLDVFYTQLHGFASARAGGAGRRNVFDNHRGVIATVVRQVRLVLRAVRVHVRLVVRADIDLHNGAVVRIDAHRLRSQQRFRICSIVCIPLRNPILQTVDSVARRLNWTRDRLDGTDIPTRHLHERRVAEQRANGEEAQPDRQIAAGVNNLDAIAAVAAVGGLLCHRRVSPVPVGIVLPSARPHLAAGLHTSEGCRKKGSTETNEFQ